ncbi:hypothetical protein DV515_00018031, partial [Chloebia gouldiae]
VAQVDTRHSSEILAQLEPWTVYCVIPAWIIVTVLVGSMLVVGTAVTVCFFSSFYLYRLFKHVFCPSYIFPQHLKEFLSKPPSAPQPFPPLPPEELLVCDKLTVISEQSQTLREGSGDEASRTAELPQDSAQGDSDSGGLEFLKFIVHPLKPLLQTLGAWNDDGITKREEKPLGKPERGNPRSSITDEHHQPQDSPLEKAPKNLIDSFQFFHFPINSASSHSTLLSNFHSPLSAPLVLWQFLKPRYSSSDSALVFPTGGVS